MAMTALPVEIGAEYEMSGVSFVSQFVSFGNENWLVQDEAGARYVLRRISQHANVERIGFQNRLVEHLRHHGFPTPEVLKTRAGSAFFSDEAGVIWMVLRYVEGTEYDFSNLRQIAEAGQQLARLHEICHSFVEACPEVPYLVPIRHHWAHAEENQDELEVMFNRRGVDEDLEFIRDWWQTILSEWPLERLDALPQGWLHGDYHGKNLVFGGEELAGLFDFDDVQPGPLIFDVATGAYKFGRSGKGSASTKRPSAEETTLRPDFMRCFLDAYARVRPLSDEERAALPAMIMTSYAPSARYYRFYRDHLRKDPIHRMRREVATLRALSDELARVEALL
jgi:homoserine kinase type II